MSDLEMEFQTYECLPHCNMSLSEDWNTPILEFTFRKMYELCHRAQCRSLDSSDCKDSWVYNDGSAYSWCAGRTCDTTGPDNELCCQKTPCDTPSGYQQAVLSGNKTDRTCVYECREGYEGDFCDLKAEEEAGLKIEVITAIVACVVLVLSTILVPLYRHYCRTVAPNNNAPIPQVSLPVAAHIEVKKEDDSKDSNDEKSKASQKYIVQSKSNLNAAAARRQSAPAPAPARQNIVAGSVEPVLL